MRYPLLPILPLALFASACGTDPGTGPSDPVPTAAKGGGQPPCEGLPAGTNNVVLDPATAQVAVGATITITATNQSGTSIPACALRWSSSNSAVATVTSTGIVSGVAAGGPVTIKAQTGDKKPLKGTATITVVPPPPDILSGLRAYFPFTGDAQDASGNNQHGTVGSGAYLAPDRFGNPDAAYGFSDPGYIDVGQLDLTGAFTLSAWIRPDIQTVGAVISKFAWANVQGYELLYAGQQAQHCMRLHTSGLRGTLGFDCGIPLELGRWYHVVGTYDGTSWGRLYLDGVLVAELSGLLPDLPGGPHTLIGRSAWGAQTFLGLIDEVRIYERALSSEQVAYLTTVP